jgi:hypothetical protein
MLVPNCIFRANGAAMLLTNKSKEARCAGAGAPAGRPGAPRRARLAPAERG